MTGRTRRELLSWSGGGFAGLALTAMLSDDGFFGPAVRECQRLFREREAKKETIRENAAERDDFHRRQFERGQQEGASDVMNDNTNFGPGYQLRLAVPRKPRTLT